MNEGLIAYRDTIVGIFQESTSLSEDFKGSTAIDAAIIFSAHAVEHIEMTHYGSMQADAKVLGLSAVAAMLGHMLQQERASDVTLTFLAERSVNAAAA